MTTAAIYARFSSSNQRDASIADQVRNCQKWADRHGAKIIATYEDQAVSGVRQDRAGYNAIMDAAIVGAFNVLLVDDLSRLGRDMPEREKAIRRLEINGVRLIGISDGYDSSQGEMARRLQRGAKGLMDELYLVDLAAKTHRGLAGQVLQGNSAGGRAYGYISKPIEHATKLDAYGRPLVVGARKVINQDQAEWVQWIFEQYAAGRSCMWIASTLNEKGIKTLRGGTWSRSTLYGDKKRPGIGLLNNKLYIGLYVWNQSKWIRDPDTGKRRRIERPQDEWETQEMPDLRIIDQALWDAVKDRQIKSYIPHTVKRGGRPNQAKYLFSGMLKCDQCGSSYVMISKYSYGCSGARNRGKAHCTNKTAIPRKTIENTLLAGIKKDLSNKESLDLFIKETRLAITEMQAQDGRGALETELVAVNKKLENLTAAIMDGLRTETTLTALEKLESHKTEIQESISELEDLPSVSAMLPRAADIYRKKVADLGNNLNDIPAAQQAIRDLVGDEIRLKNSENGLVALISSAPFSALPLAGKTGGKTLVVAGARFGQRLHRPIKLAG